MGLYVCLRVLQTVRAWDLMSPCFMDVLFSALMVSDGYCYWCGGGQTWCVCVYTVYGPVELLFYVMYWYGAYPSIIDDIAGKVLGRASEVGDVGGNEFFL